MANSYFSFKQFTVFHDRCAMKVGTDGVLLGVWSDVSSSGKILDVGTGSGLIALILAQRNSASYVLAIDTDLNAVYQAKDNFQNSPFNNRLKVNHVSFQDFTQNTLEKFSHIVSNPPYFIQSMKSPDDLRTIARHNDSLPLDRLIQSSKEVVLDGGKLSLILPFDQKDEALEYAQECGWGLSRMTTVFPTTHSKPKRILLEFTDNYVGNVYESNLVIEFKRHQYSPEFIELTKEFYLNH